MLSGPRLRLANMAPKKIAIISGKNTVKKKPILSRKRILMSFAAMATIVLTAFSWRLCAPSPAARGR